jgi:Cu(I)/Ag(I) efflux system membrane fusion protein/cobalt-zinc-cadmium efflux system membrane fusion protein
MKKLIVIAVLSVILGLCAGWLVFYPSANQTGKSTAEASEIYICPMHPQIVQDKPGDCPICGMDLVLKQAKDEHAGHTPKTMYRSSMNPNEISDKPGKDSMGMDMIPFEPEEKDTETPAGLASVSVSEKQRKIIGLTFGAAEMKNITREIRTSARIVPDETRLFLVTTRLEGWVDELYVNQTGQYVKKGQPLLAIYSPELLAAQQEYLTSLAAMKNLDQPFVAANPVSFTGMEAAAREKLRLFGISDAQIDHLRDQKKALRVMILESPASGFVTEKPVIRGQRVMINEPLMTITDLSRVWAEADIYETDLPYIKTGIPAEISLSYWPEKRFPGQISFLYPFLEAATRTIKARIELANPELVLKPGMFAVATIFSDSGERLTVPEAAVMRTGIIDYVFVEGNGDKFVPVQVKLGMRSGDGFYEVLSGLETGQRVVTSANFLIDSESSLKAALQTAIDAGAHQH